MVTILASEVALEKLARYDGEAKPVTGRVALRMLKGNFPVFVSNDTYLWPQLHVCERGVRRALPDNKEFFENLLRQESFRHSFVYDKRAPSGVEVFPAQPVFAPDVRRERNRGPTPEKRMEARREDCFVAETPAIRYADPSSNAVIRPFVKSRISCWEMLISELFED